MTWPLEATSPVRYWHVAPKPQVADGEEGGQLGFKLILKQATHASILHAKLDVDLGASSTVAEVEKRYRQLEPLGRMYQVCVCVR